MLRPIWRTLLAALGLVGPLAASAAATVPADSEVKGLGDQPAAWIVSIENDKFFAGTDHHYTQGGKITRLYNRPATGPFEKWLQAQLELAKLKLSSAKIARSIGQDIFTPGDTDTPSLVADDRPYAGWFYYSIGYHAIVNDTHSWIVEATAGIVGPSALGETFQNGWHGLLDIAPANGWINQLHDEPGLNLAVEHRWRLSGGGHWDAVPRAGFVVGNVNTHASVGGALRFGWDLPEDFGYDLIRAGSGNVVKSADKFSAYAFIGADARLVARNIFLDGNTWRDSHSVRKRPLTWDMNVGVALNWPRFRVIYTQNYRAREFYGQPHRDVFGSISVAYLH